MVLNYVLNLKMATSEMATPLTGNTIQSRSKMSTSEMSTTGPSNTILRIVFR